MNLNLKGWTKYQLDGSYENTDISICFQQVVQYYKKLFEDKRSQEYQTEMSNKQKPYNKRNNYNVHKVSFVIETLAKKNFEFQKRKEVCTISQMTKDVPIEFIIRQILRKYQKTFFNIYDSQIDEEFFKILSRLQTEIKAIGVDFCNIGNSFPKYIKQHIATQKLQEIKIASDPIDNKGLKKLFSLNLPQLFFIYLFNLNSTPDIWNVIQKLNTTIGLQGVSIVSTHLHSTITKITHNISKIINSFRIWFHNTYIYLNEFSKVQLKPNSSNKVKIYLLKQIDVVNQRKFNPLELFEYLENITLYGYK